MGNEEEARFMQQDGKHFDSHDKSSLVVSTVDIRITMVLTLVGGWYHYLANVEGAFLNGVFEHLVYLMRYFRPDVLNRVRELSSFMQEASRDCYKALI